MFCVNRPLLVWLLRMACRLSAHKFECGLVDIDGTPIHPDGRVVLEKSANLS